MFTGSLAFSDLHLTSCIVCVSDYVPETFSSNHWSLFPFIVPDSQDLSKDQWLWSADGWAAIRETFLSCSVEMRLNHTVSSWMEAAGGWRSEREHFLTFNLSLKRGLDQSCFLQSLQDKLPHAGEVPHAVCVRVSGPRATLGSAALNTDEL